MPFLAGTHLRTPCRAERELGYSLPYHSRSCPYQTCSCPWSPIQKCPLFLQITPTILCVTPTHPLCLLMHTLLYWLVQDLPWPSGHRPPCWPSQLLSQSEHAWLQHIYDRASSAQGLDWALGLGEVKWQHIVDCLLSFLPHVFPPLSITIHQVLSLNNL